MRGSIGLGATVSGIGCNHGGARTPVSSESYKKSYFDFYNVLSGPVYIGNLKYYLVLFDVSELSEEVDWALCRQGHGFSRERHERQALGDGVKGIKAKGG